MEGKRLIIYSWLAVNVHPLEKSFLKWEHVECVFAFIGVWSVSLTYLVHFYSAILFVMLHEVLHSVNNNISTEAGKQKQQQQQ